MNELILNDNQKEVSVMQQRITEWISNIYDIKWAEGKSLTVKNEIPSCL